MAEKSVRNKTENWTQDYSTYFWTPDSPFEVKFEIEKTMRLLLARDSTETTKLTYSGSDSPPFIGRDVQLRFEAALPGGNWYSLRVTAWVPHTWYTEAEFRRNVNPASDHWTRILHGLPEIGTLEGASQELYDKLAHDALEKEARRAAEKEDLAPAIAIKQQILSEMRNGKSFRTIHHEGGTTIYFDGKSFIRSEYGEQESNEVLGTEDEVLRDIRALYDWESRKDSFPHPPPERDVWLFIQKQMM
jgi:hypothetical protein